MPLYDLKTQTNMHRQTLQSRNFFLLIISFSFTLIFSSLDGVAVFLVPATVLWSSGSALRLTVHSRNDKGASERIMLQALTYQDPERRTGE